MMKEKIRISITEDPFKFVHFHTKKRSLKNIKEEDGEAFEGKSGQIIFPDLLKLVPAPE